jgi:hypothetical protein
MSGKRIFATFVPEAWITDHAVEVDGREKFDATAKILAMSEEERQSLRDDTHASDNLVPQEIRTGHSGPFRVEVEEAMAAYFSDAGVPEN